MVEANSDGRSSANFPNPEGDFLFEYDILFHCWICGDSYEFHKRWRSRVQLRVGDVLNIDGLDECRVEEVVWYLEHPGEAFVNLGEFECDGEPSDWEFLLGDMDYVAPVLPPAEPA